MSHPEQELAIPSEMAAATLGNLLYVRRIQTPVIYPGSTIFTNQDLTIISPDTSFVVEVYGSPNNTGLLRNNMSVKFQVDAFALLNVEEVNEIELQAITGSHKGVAYHMGHAVGEFFGHAFDVPDEYLKDLLTTNHKKERALIFERS